VYGDEAKRWTGPFVVQEFDGNNVQLIVDSKGPKPFSITRCKLAVFPYDVRWTENLEPIDPRASSKKIDSAKWEEILNLFKR
jgi:hypothetical protein